jgi:hypothetical protein
MRRLIIVVEGGLIQEIFSNANDIEVIVCDYDIDGTEDDELMEAPDGDMGYHSLRNLEYEPGLVDAWFARYRKKELEETTEGRDPNRDHEKCAICGECITCNIRQCRNGEEHTREVK